MGKGPLLLQNDSPFLWQFSLEPLGSPRYSAPSAALFSSSTAPTARGLLSMILPLCRTLRWPARAQLSFGLEDVEPQLILKGWDVIPKYFYLLSIYYPIFLNIINCLLAKQVVLQNLLNMRPVLCVKISAKLKGKVLPPQRGQLCILQTSA